MVRAGLYKTGEVDLSRVSTTRFVNRRVGLDVKKQLGGR
jgi:NitT/TauT family transport system substrate-binding protein